MNIVITGGTSGLGLALKEYYEKNGHNVYVLARSANGENGIKCDVSNFESIENAFEILKTKCHKIDMLINNAGVALSGATELLPREEIDKIVDINLKGVIFCTQKALALMSKGGKIVNISSPCGDFPLAYRTMYCVTKSALSMFSYCLRLELENAGIAVTAICPGNIFTNLSNNRIKIATTNEKYGDEVEKATNKINQEAHKRMTLDYVVKVITKKLAKKKLSARYVIGKKYKFLYLVQKLVPQKALFWGVSKFCK